MSAIEEKAKALGARYADEEFAAGAARGQDAPLSGERADGPTHRDVYQQLTSHEWVDEFTDEKVGDAWELIELWEDGYHERWAAIREDPDIPHRGHHSHFGGTWFCDTCNSPYCERA